MRLNFLDYLNKERSMNRLMSFIVLSVVVPVCVGTVFVTPVYASRHNSEVLADYIAAHRYGLKESTPIFDDLTS
jgi:hypothetical protein